MKKKKSRKIENPVARAGQTRRVFVRNFLCGIGALALGVGGVYTLAMKNRSTPDNEQIYNKLVNKRTIGLGVVVDSDWVDNNGLLVYIPISHRGAGVPVTHKVRNVQREVHHICDELIRDYGFGSLYHEGNRGNIDAEFEVKGAPPHMISTVDRRRDFYNQKEGIFLDAILSSLPTSHPTSLQFIYGDLISQRGVDSEFGELQKNRSFDNLMSYASQNLQTVSELHELNKRGQLSGTQAREYINLSGELVRLVRKANEEVHERSEGAVEQSLLQLNAAQDHRGVLTFGSFHTKQILDSLKGKVSYLVICPNTLQSDYSRISKVNDLLSDIPVVTELVYGSRQ